MLAPLRAIAAVLPLKLNIDSRFGENSDIERVAQGLIPSLIRAGYSRLIRNLVIICPPGDVLAIQERLVAFNSFPIEVCSENAFLDNLGYTTESFSKVPGWLRQQLLKLAAASSSSSEIMLVLDADVLATKCVSERNLGGLEIPYQMMGADRFRGWFRASARALNIDYDSLPSSVLQQAMGVTPEFLCTNVARDLINHLKARSRTEKWGPYLMDHFTNYEETWTEYTLYWLWYSTNSYPISYKPCDFYKFVEDVSELRPQLIQEASSFFVVLQSTKLTTSECKEIYRVLNGSGNLGRIEG